MSDFYKTIMGHKFYEGTVPQIARELVKLNANLERIAVALEEASKRNQPPPANDRA